MKDVTGKGGTFKMPMAVAYNFVQEFYDDFNESNNYFIPKYVFNSGFRLGRLADEKIVKTISNVAEFYRNIAYYSASQFTNPSKCPVSFETDERGRPVRRDLLHDGHGKWLHDMYRGYKTNSQGYKQFEEIVGRNGIGLIDKIEFMDMEVSETHVNVRIGGKLRKQKKQTKLIIPRIHIRENVLSPTQLSEGTFKTLAMVFYLMTGFGKVILLEEPEVCIHHGLLSSLIELIKQYSSEKQVFISTHSDFILDELDETNVFVVENKFDEGITLRSLGNWLSQEDMHALKAFLASEGSLGEYWRMGGIDE